MVRQALNKNQMPLMKAPTPKVLKVHWLRKPGAEDYKGPIRTKTISAKPCEGGLLRRSCKVSLPKGKAATGITRNDKRRQKPAKLLSTGSFCSLSTVDSRDESPIRLEGSRTRWDREKEKKWEREKAKKREYKRNYRAKKKRQREMLQQLDKVNQFSNLEHNSSSDSTGKAMLQGRNSLTNSNCSSKTSDLRKFNTSPESPGACGSARRKNPCSGGSHLKTSTSILRPSRFERIHQRCDCAHSPDFQTH